VACIQSCETYCTSHREECITNNVPNSTEGLSAFDSYEGLSLFGDGGYIDASPPSLKPKPNGWGVILPLLLITFFCCFVFQTYQKNGGGGGRRGVRTATHESEGINLVDTFSNTRKFVSNRAADAFDRRRDPRLAANDFSRNNDPDEDTML